MPKISCKDEKIRMKRQEAERIALILFDRINIHLAKILLQEIVLAPLSEFRLEQLRRGDNYLPDKDRSEITFIRNCLDSFSF